MELAGLRAMAFVDEDEDLALGIEVFGKIALNVLEEGVDVAFL